ncbi:PucR family transcriptional regulator [Salimicrobium jeotgali]|nr:helix-turn-helix domain-containing protein [Salimicrobium jeotgali]MBM7695996.1 sugar diacid utilization regulator [Salimicrobium jeotgali]
MSPNREIDQMPDSPEGLADYIAGKLGCPVTIEDANHRIVSYSSHETNVDNARSATIMQRKVPEHVVNGLWQAGVMGNLFESGTPVFVSPLPAIGLGNRIAISVWKNKEVLGFIWAQTEQIEMSHDKISQLKEAASLASRHLQKQRDRKREKEENIRSFMHRLFHGTAGSRAEIEKQARKLHLSLEGSLSVAALEFMEAITPSVERHASYLTETFRRKNITSHMFEDDSLLLLIHTNGEEAENVTQELLRDFRDKLKERTGISDIRSTYGKVCKRPEDVYVSYHQAQKTLELKNRYPEALAGVTTFRELGVYQFIQEITVLYEQENYKNSVIEAIKAYDRSHNTSLLETLRSFLHYNSTHQAARQLHIHTNTLLYRLKRIREITGADLEDTNQKTKLFIDLIIQG